MMATKSFDEPLYLDTIEKVELMLRLIDEAERGVGKRVPSISDEELEEELRLGEEFIKNWRPSRGWITDSESK